MLGEKMGRGVSLSGKLMRSVTIGSLYRGREAGGLKRKKTEK